MLHEPLDRTALPGRVASLEHHDHLLTGFLDPVLNLQQFDLQLLLLLFVGRRLKLALVGIHALPEDPGPRVGIQPQRCKFAVRI